MYSTVLPSGSSDETVHLLIFLAEPLAFEFASISSPKGDFLACSQDPLQSLFVATLDQPGREL